MSRRNKWKEVKEGKGKTQERKRAGMGLHSGTAIASGHAGASWGSQKLIPMETDGQKPARRGLEK